MVHKLVFIGMGGVGRTFLEMLPMTDLVPKSYWQNIIIIEPRDLSEEPTIKHLVEKKISVEVVPIEITSGNIRYLLNKYVQKSDIVIDVSYNIDFAPLIGYCFEIGAMYINTSMECYPTEGDEILEDRLYDRTLHYMHEDVNALERKFLKTYSTLPTAIVMHGMNPGLVSHFVKLGLHKIGDTILKLAHKYELKSPALAVLKKACESDDFATMAYIMQLRVVHCSERDTQLAKMARKQGEFMNTWGPYSFWAEGIDPIQIGIGTHESQSIDETKTVVINGKRFEVQMPSSKPFNQIYAKIRGIDVMFESYVPVTDKHGELVTTSSGGYKSGLIKGMAIPHCENDSCNRYLSLYAGEAKHHSGEINDKPKTGEKGKLIYRPSNYYVYSPCKAAWESFQEIRANKYKMLPIQHSLRGYEIKSGEDAVGALLIFEMNPLSHLLLCSTGLDDMHKRQADNLKDHDSKSKNYDAKLVERITKKIKELSRGSESNNSFWTGTILSIDETRDLGIKYSGPTTVQVGISLLSAIHWMLKNKNKGLVYPESIPYREILKHSFPYLGRIFCDFVPYKVKDMTLKALSDV